MMKFVIVSLAFVVVLHAAPKSRSFDIEALISRLARTMIVDDEPRKTAVEHMFSDVSIEDLEELRDRMRNMTSIAMKLFEYTEEKIMNIMMPSKDIPWKKLSEIPKPPERLTRALHKMLFRTYMTTMRLFLFGLKSDHMAANHPVCDPHTKDLEVFFECVMEKAEMMSEMKSTIEYEILEGFDSDQTHPFHVPQCNSFEDVFSMNGPRHTTACDAEPLTIICQHGTIAVQHTDFGHPGKDVCPYSKAYGNPKIECSPANRENVKKKCEGQKTCTLTSRKDVLEDPCYDNYKYLSIEYTCSMQWETYELGLRDAIIDLLMCTGNVVKTFINRIKDELQDEVKATIPINDLMRNIVRRLAIAEMSMNIFEETLQPIRRLADMADMIKHELMKPKPSGSSHLKDLMDELRALTKKNLVVT